MKIFEMFCSHKWESKQGDVHVCSRCKKLENCTFGIIKVDSVVFKGEKKNRHYLKCSKCGKLRIDDDNP